MKKRQNKNLFSRSVQGLLIGYMALFASACATDLQTKVAGNLKALSKNQTVAILPIETSHAGQKEMAEMFRQGLYANLKQSEFHLLERYIVDGLLKQNNLTEPSNFLTINPMQFGEILGVDAIVFSRINKVERSYFIVHSSIELSVSVQMVDTRSGEILWRAEQTEHDFSGIGKIPTGITTAILAPIQFVTNKFNLSRMTSKMVDKLTALVRHPNEADKETQFEEPVIAKNATTDLNKIEELQQLKSEWEQALVLDEETERSNFKKNAEGSSKLGKIEEQTMEVAAKEVPYPAQENDISSTISKDQGVESEMLPLPQKQEVKKPEGHLTEVTAKPATHQVERANEIPTNFRTIKQVESEMLSPQPNNEIKKPESFSPIPMNSLRASIAAPKIWVEDRTKKSQPKNQIKPASEAGQRKNRLQYTIQVGAYKTKAYAKKMEQSLIEKGYNAFVTRNAKKIYRVQVDLFQNKEDAVQLAKHIQTKEKLKNFVTPL